VSTAAGATLGIDFGTSNSAAAWRRGAEPARALRLEGEHFALPTALFFNAEDRPRLTLAAMRWRNT
jgi:hypothetical chaperone protein